MSVPNNESASNLHTTLNVLHPILPQVMQAICDLGKLRGVKYRDIYDYVAMNTELSNFKPARNRLAYKVRKAIRTATEMGMLRRSTNGKFQLTCNTNNKQVRRNRAIDSVLRDNDDSNDVQQQVLPHVKPIYFFPLKQRQQRRKRSLCYRSVSHRRKLPRSTSCRRRKLPSLSSTNKRHPYFVAKRRRASLSMRKRCKTESKNTSEPDSDVSSDAGGDDIDGQPTNNDLCNLITRNTSSNKVRSKSIFSMGSQEGTTYKNDQDTKPDDMKRAIQDE